MWADGLKFRKFDSHISYLYIGIVLCVLVAASSLFLVTLQGNVATLSIRLIVISYSLFISLLGIYIFISIRKKYGVALLILVGGQVYWFALPAIQIAANPNIWYGDNFGLPLSNAAVVSTVVYLYYFAFISLFCYIN